MTMIKLKKEESQWCFASAMRALKPLEQTVFLRRNIARLYARLVSIHAHSDWKEGAPLPTDRSLYGMIQYLGKGKRGLSRTTAQRHLNVMRSVGLLDLDEFGAVVIKLDALYAEENQAECAAVAAADDDLDF